MALTLHGIGTAVPLGSITRDEAIALAEHVGTGESRQTALLQRIHQRSGVSQRGSVLIADQADQDSFLERVPFYSDTNPSTEERIEMTLKSGKEPGMTARDYLAFVSEQRAAMGVSDESGLSRALETALGEMEGKSGKPLMVDDAAGMKTLYSKVEALVKEMGLEQGDAKKESMVLEAEYEIQKLQEEVAKNKA